MDRTMPGTRHAITRFVLRGTLLILLLAVVGIGILWTRLSNGPIPLTFLKAAISETMSASLPGFTTRFDAVTLALDDGALELQLTNVHVRDVVRGDLVAVSPTAAISLSSAALLGGQIAAEHIDLVRPAMRLFYSRKDGIALSFTRPVSASEVPAPVPAGPSAPLPAQEAANLSRAPASPTGSDAPAPSIFQPPPAGTGIIDLSRTMHRLVMGQAVGDATRYLKSFGVRGATLLIDDPDEPARLAVRRILLSLEPLARGSRVTGLVDIAEADGGLIEFVAEPSARNAAGTGAFDRNAPINLRIDVAALNPAVLSAKVAPLRAFRSLNAATRMTSKLTVAATGDVLAASLDMGADRGTIDVDQAGANVEIPLDKAAFDLRYDRAKSRFDIGPSTIGWDGHSITFIGSITHNAAAPMPDQWTFSLTGTEGHFSPASINGRDAGSEARRHAIEQFAAQGRIVVSGDAGIQLEQALVGVEGGVLTVTGAVSRRDGAVGELVGSVSNLPREVVLAMWPETVLPSARAFLNHSIVDGTIHSGRFALKEDGLRTAGSQPQRDAEPMLLSLAARDVRLKLHDEVPVFVAPQLDFAVARDGGLSALAAQVAVDGVAIEEFRLENAAYVLTPAAAGSSDARLTASFNGGLERFAQLADAAKAAWSYADDGSSEDRLQRPTFTDGRIAGQMALAFPATAAAGEPPIMTGTAQVSGAQFAVADLPYRMSGGRMDLELSQRALIVSGKLNVGEVATNISMHQLLEQDADAGSPLRLTATLNRAGRRQFGFDLGGVINGATPVEVVLPEFPVSGRANVVVDLSAARLMFASLGFDKPTGERAQLEFEIDPKSDGTVALENLRLTGERTAIQGQALIGRSGHLESFDFPAFSLDLVSRVQLRGTRRVASSRSVLWEISATGPVIDGKGIFKGLSSLTDGSVAAEADEPGLDLRGTFETVLGFDQTSLRDVQIRLSKRRGRLTSLTGQGRLSDGGRVEVGIEPIENRRRLVARTNNAGSTLRMMDFYQNMRGGDMRLQVDLDGGARAVRTGTVSVTNFAIFGDPIVSEVVLAGGTGQRPAIARGVRPARATRETIPFTNLVADFEIGHDQFVIREAQATGPVIGGSLRGKADYGRQTIHVGGTYSFLQPLNRLPAILPGIGEILTGPRREGVLALNFAVRGPMSEPQVLVNPLSAVMPGIFREIFTLSPQTSRVIPRTSVGQEEDPADASGRRAAPPSQRPTRIIGDWSPTTRPAWSVDPFEAR